MCKKLIEQKYFLINYEEVKQYANKRKRNKL